MSEQHDQKQHAKASERGSVTAAGAQHQSADTEGQMYANNLFEASH